MTPEEFSVLSQTIGTIAVVASLIFVGLQEMESAKAVRSATAQAVHDNYASWYITLADNEHALATSAKAFGVVPVAASAPEASGTGLTLSGAAAAPSRGPIRGS